MAVAKALVASLLISIFVILLVEADMATATTDLAKGALPPQQIDCGGLCGARCRLSSRPNLCKRACGSCCGRCQCVPPGTAGNHEACPCYASLTTRGNKRKCP